MSQTTPPIGYRTSLPQSSGAMTPAQKVIYIVLAAVMVVPIVVVLVLLITGMRVAKITPSKAAPAQQEKVMASGRPEGVLFVAPRFALTDQDGKPFSADNLRGKPFICDFIFTMCGSACPMMTHKLADLQKQTPVGVQLVSFTVNPEHDTPGVLKDYAAANGADPARWHFLTGTTRQMVETVRGMKLGFQPATDHDPILHSEKFLLIDGDGNVRGAYDSLDVQSMKDLVSDAAWLASTPGGRGK